MTNGTLEALLFRVRGLVGFEQVLVAEAPGADVAQEGFVVRLFGLALRRLVMDAVQRQGLAVDEVTSAHLALEHFLGSVGLLAAVRP